MGLCGYCYDHKWVMRVPGCKSMQGRGTAVMKMVVIPSGPVSSFESRCHRKSEEKRSLVLGVLFRALGSGKAREKGVLGRRSQAETGEPRSRK